MTTGFPILDKVLAAHDGAQRGTLLDILRNRDGQFTAENVSTTLKLHGYSVSASTIRTYRRRLSFGEGK